MRVPVLVYLILSQNVLHESLQKLILRFVAGLVVIKASAKGGGAGLCSWRNEYFQALVRTPEGTTAALTALNS
jgi:hypothetical protein